MEKMEPIIKKNKLLDTSLKHQTEVFIKLAKDNEWTKLLEMIEAGMSPNVSDEDNNSALMHTAQQGHLETVNALIKFGANINLQNKNGYTALIYASRYGHLDIVNSLLKAGADPNISDTRGYSPLLITIAVEANKNSLEIVQALLKAGADPNSKNEDGNFALLVAADKGDLNIINALLDAGANPTLRNNEGRMAISRCNDGKNQSQCLQILNTAVQKYNYKKDKKSKQMRGLITVGTPKGSLPIVPKDIWRMILKRRIQLELCADLNKEDNRYDLLLMAEMDFQVPKQIIDESWRHKSMRELCKILSGLLSIGAMYSEKALEYLVKREKLRQGADIGLKFIEFLNSVGIDQEYEEEYMDEKTGQKRTRTKQKTLNELLEEVAMMQNVRF